MSLLFTQLKNSKNAMQLSRSVVFVIGNESCDMDSFASSILTAFFFHRLAPEQQVVPLMNIPRSYLDLRADIVHTMTTLGIKNEWLLFIDDDCIKTRKSQGCDDKLFLVDHNRVTPPMKKLLGDYVEGIIDHHADEGLYRGTIGSGPRIIERSGSCSTLVMNYWRKKVPEEIFSSHPQLVILALCPLLLDTSNMKYKVEPSDRNNFEFLTSNLDETFDTTELFETLQKKKKDLSSLSVKGILAKDYKEWSSEVDGDGRGKLGISSISESIQWMEKNHPNVYEELKEWASENGLSVAVMMMKYKSDGQHHRQLVMWINKDEEEANVSVASFVSIQQAGELGLSPVYTEVAKNAGVQIYEQGNINASRKLVAPLLRQQLYGASLITLGN